jgi:hypothetical protein
MNKSILPFFVAVILAGCATANTPSEIRALGIRGKTEINQPYSQAASCVLQQIDRKVNNLINRSFVINHTLRISQDGQYAEIIADPIIGNQNVGGTYVISIRPTGQNSSIAEIYVSNNMVFPGSIADGLRQAASNCNR